MIALSMQSNLFSGDLSGWILPSSLTYIQISFNQFTGNISNWIIPNSLLSINIAGTSSYYFSGDLSGWILPNGTTRFYSDYNRFTKLPRGAYNSLDSSIGYYAVRANANTSELDSLLADIDSYATTHTPLNSSRFVLSGTGNGIPSADGLASKASIENKWAKAGYVATITVNS